MHFSAGMSSNTDLDDPDLDDPDRNKFWDKHQIEKPLQTFLYHNALIAEGFDHCSFDCLRDLIVVMGVKQLYYKWLG